MRNIFKRNRKPRYENITDQEFPTCNDPLCGCNDIDSGIIMFSNTDFLDELKSRINERYENATALTDAEKSVASMSNAEDTCIDATGQNLPTASRDLPSLVSQNYIRNHIEFLKDEIAYYEFRLSETDVPEDVTSAFSCFTDDPEHSIIGDPFEIARDDDYVTAGCRVIFQGEPYCILAIVNFSPDDTEVQSSTHYIYLDDDFGFSLADKIFNHRRVEN